MQQNKCYISGTFEISEKRLTEHYFFFQWKGFFFIGFINSTDIQIRK